MNLPNFEKYNTVPKLFWYHVIQNKDKVSNWVKVNGLWESMTWGEYGQKSKKIGLALLAAGARPGDKISILSQTRVEWVLCDMAIMSIGCVTAPIYHSNTDEQVHYIAEHSGSRIAFVEDQEQLDKMLAIWNRLPNLEKIIVFDKYVPQNIPNVMRLKEFENSAEIFEKQHSEEFEKCIEASEPEAIISLIYTSGTTGHPKAGMINSRNVISIIRHLPNMVELKPEDMTVAYLPLAHIAERLLGHFIKLAYGNETAFAESIEDMPMNVRQTGPTVLFGTPRVFEKFFARISMMMKDATFLQKSIYSWALEVGKSITLQKTEGNKITGWLKIKSVIAKFLIHNKIQDIFGGSLRFMISGAAPISPEIIHYFNWVGITIYEGYGMTETSGVISCNYPGNVKIGSVGKVMPETEVRIADNGEICVRAPQNITGYYKNDEATRELLKSDGNSGFWLHTGDVGHFDEDGYLFITDRKKDILITAGGKNVAPQNIENLLKSSPYVSLAMVTGDRKPYLTALITLDEDEITKFARDRKILYQDLADLTKKQEVLDLIHHEISQMNRDLASYETIKKFRILEEELDQDKDEITPTLKVKRKVVISHYQHLIDGMYG